ncbi:glycosyltransferase family 2 protein [Marivirga harenae]|uniref:glycosyltransferase family 2 protein n=1 Tax=Marivirga harenae TaxID=2010992 RepID=UPI0026DF1432|nr:glycosyltransferase [Marivirga harenae]WKV13426.1 glycosyltransferase [Marivirga harenae]
MTSPLVSVLMPVYNSERYLEDAIESILNQTLFDFEFLIFDDGSTDKSKEIIQKYAISDKRIKPYFSKENRGYVVHLNKGIELARGEYIARMDSDDISMPDRLQVQLDYLNKNSGIIICGTESISIDENGRSLGWPKRLTEPSDLFFISFFINPLAHPTVMYSKEAIIKLGGYNPKKLPSEDYDLWTRAILVGKLGNIDQPLLKYRQHNQSITARKREIQRSNSNETLRTLWFDALHVELSTEETLFLRNFHKGYDMLPPNRTYALYKKLRKLKRYHKSKNSKISPASSEFYNKRVVYLLLISRRHSFLQFSNFLVKLLCTEPLVLRNYLLNK